MDIRNDFSGERLPEGDKPAWPWAAPPQRPMATDSGITRVDRGEQRRETETPDTDALFTRPARHSALVPVTDKSVRPVEEPQRPMVPEKTDRPLVEGDVVDGADISPSRTEERPRYLDQRLVDSRRSTILGQPAAARFLARQAVRTEAMELVRDAELDPDAPPGTRLVVALNLTPRPKDDPKNLNLQEPVYRIADAGVFDEGGLVEQLPPRHAAEALAAATARGNKEAVTTHSDVIRGVARVLTERYRDPETGAIITVRPNLQQIAEGVEIWDRGRIAQQYPERPTSLEHEQVRRLQQVAHTDRLDINRVEVDRLRARLASDVLDDDDDQVIGLAAGVYEGQQEIELFPVPSLESGHQDSGQRAVVHIARISVSPDSYLGRLEAEVRAAAVGALALIAKSRGRLVIEGAEKLVKIAPELLEEIETVCANQEPPIPLTLTFTEPVDQMAPFVRGELVVVGPMEPWSAELIGRVLPRMPMVDVTGVASNHGANDGTNIGQGLNMGYDPDKAKPNNGTSSSAGGSSGTNYGVTVTKQISMRQPRGDELTQGIGPWQAAVWSSDGEFQDIYDLHQRGIPLGARLPNMLTQEEMQEEMSMTVDVRAEIARIEAEQQAIRDALADGAVLQAAKQRQVGRQAMPALPPPPAPPEGSYMDGRIKKMTPPQQLRELAYTLQGRTNMGGLKPGFVKNDVIGHWESITSPEILQRTTRAERAWREWGRAAGLTPGEIRMGWRARMRRMK